MANMVMHESAIEEIKINTKGDVILVDPSDASFWEKYTGLITAIEAKGNELDATGQDLEKKYEGRPAIKKDEDGNDVVDTEQFAEYAAIQVEFYKFVVSEIEKVFGEGVLKKYFIQSYELNPDFIPDESLIYEFVENIGAVLAEIYQKRKQTVQTKYNARRSPKK